MTESMNYSDEDFYTSESFEEDSVSEIEEIEEEVKVGHDKKPASSSQARASSATDYVDSETDNLSESDAESEFVRGNPHAKRQQFYSSGLSGSRVPTGRGSGFKRDNLLSGYPSSSEEDEQNVRIQKTVAEVNVEPPDAECLSVRTLVPNMVKGGESDGSEDDEVVVQSDDLDSIDEETEEEPDAQAIVHVPKEDSDSVSDESTVGYQPSDSEYSKTYTPQMNIRDGNETDITITPHTFPSNASNHKVPRQKLPIKKRYSPPLAKPTCQPKQKTERPPVSKPEPEYQLTDCSSEEEEAEPVDERYNGYVKEQNARVEVPQINVGGGLSLPLPNIANLEDKSLFGQPMFDEAAIKYLEEQMAEITHKMIQTFRSNGSSSGKSVREKPSKENKLDKRMTRDAKAISDDLEEPIENDEQSHSISESEPSPSEPGYGGNDTNKSKCTFSSMETLNTVRSMTSVKTKCRCPIYDDQVEEGDSVPEYLMEEDYDQGDGMAPHTHHDHEHEMSCRFASEPSSYGSDNYFPNIGLKRPRSSSDKVNYKNLGRKSFSFTNTQIREIERQNQILLKKVMSIKSTIKVNNKPSTTQLPKKKAPMPPSTRTTTSAVNRKKNQRQIDIDNDVLKRKLEAIGQRRPIFK